MHVAVGVAQELVRRLGRRVAEREPGADVLAVTRELYAEEDELDDSEEAGVAIPATMGLLGLAFIGCALVISGLPPLSGFIAKFALLTAVLDSQPSPQDGAVAGIGWLAWLVLVVLILSGLAALIAMTRSGIRTFWASMEGTKPRVLVIEVAPILLLLAATLFLTTQAGPVMRYMDDTTRALTAPQQYIDAVINARRAGTVEVQP